MLQSKIILAAISAYMIPHGQYALSTTRRIASPQPKSTVIHCPHFKECSGCVATQELTATSVSNRARMVLEPFLQTPLDVKLTTEADGWRTQARLAAGALGTGKSWERGASLGLYAGGTHEIVPIPDCVVHDDIINKASKLLIEACEKAGVRGGEHLRYVQFAVERKSGLVALTLVWNEINAKDAAPHLSRLVNAVWGKKKRSETWHSIWVNYRGAAAGNAIFNYNPQRWTRLRGDHGDHVIETLFLESQTAAAARGAGLDADLSLRFSPLNFRQANLGAFAQLVIAMAKYIPKGAVACELYAGVGAIGLALRPKLTELRCSDENTNNEKPFELALRDQDARIPNAAPAFFLPLPAADAATIDAPGADLLIVDPPRKGLDPQLLDDLVHGAPHFAALQRIIYVSCGFDAFERDLAALATDQNAPWKLVHAEAHIFFPGSDHIETLAIFDRQQKPGARRRPPSATSFENDRGPLASSSSADNIKRRRRARTTNNNNKGAPPTSRNSSSSQKRKKSSNKNSKNNNNNNHKQERS